MRSTIGSVPILDTGFVVAKRLKYHQPIYQADRWHFHHRMANKGFSQRRTLAYLYGWTLVLAGSALALSPPRLIMTLSQPPSTAARAQMAPTPASETEFGFPSVVIASSNGNCSCATCIMLRGE